jgi:hypothetical protein
LHVLVRGLGVRAVLSLSIAYNALLFVVL